jgi:4-hydroxyacetophenone monooxygenase
MELNLYNSLKDPEKLMDLLKEADIATLSLVLSHITSDLSYVDKIKPFVKGAFDYSVNVPENYAYYIRSKLIEVLQVITNKNNSLNNINNIKEENLSYIMSAGVGAEIKDEYIPMMKEELGFDNNSIRDRSINNIKKHKSKPNVVIIGSGLCGILAGIKLSKAGIPFIIIEKNDSIGGTWYENTYPGCGVDTPNHVYAYSFEPSFHWEEFYSKRDAILEYLKKCVNKYNLSDHIKLNTTVESTVFDEDTKSWNTSVICNNNKSILNSNIVISAVGQLNKPSVPDINGIDEFNGPIIHTGAWDSSFNYKDKNIALIGTGASGMQVAPEIAKEAKSLTIFQRTPHWIIANPNYHRKLSAGKKWVLKNIPFYSKWYRLQLFWGFCDGIHASLYKDPDWKFPDRSLNHTNERFRVNMVKHIEGMIGNDKDLLKKVIPNYPPYGKRMLMDNNWFEMLKKDNVQLITDKVNRITNSSIDTDICSYNQEAIIMATGFEASKMIWPIKVVGKKGINLNDFWNNDNPKAHVGITVPNFPNFFIMYGPNTNLAHGGSIVFHGECQIRYILGCIDLLLEKNHKIMDCRQEPFEEYNSNVDTEHSKMVWTHDKVNSWYRNGNGRVITNSPWRLVDYWNFTKEPIEKDYKFN